MFLAVAAPTGGLGSFPALVKGDPGDTPTIDTTIVLTPLAYSDSTPDSASWTVIGPNTYRLSIALHEGAPGAAGGTILHTATDLVGTATAGNLIVVNPTADGFVYAAPKVGDRYVPATISAAPSGNSVYTLATVSIPAQQFDWRPDVSGQCQITGTGTDIRVDLVARLADPAAGNIVGRAIGMAGQTPPTHILSAGPPAASASTYDKVAAGSAASIYLRAERQSGADTFTTSAATTTFQVRVCPIP